MNCQNIFKIVDLKIHSIINIPILKALSEHIDLVELQNFRSYYSLWVPKVPRPVQVPLLFLNVLLKRTFFQKTFHSRPLACSVKDVLAVKVSSCTSLCTRKVSNVNGSDWCHSLGFSNTRLQSLIINWQTDWLQLTSLSSHKHVVDNHTLSKFQLSNGYCAWVAFWSLPTLPLTAVFLSRKRLIHIPCSYLTKNKMVHFCLQIQLTIL